MTRVSKKPVIKHYPTGTAGKAGKAGRAGQAMLHWKVVSQSLSQSLECEVATATVGSRTGSKKNKKASGRCGHPASSDAWDWVWVLGVVSKGQASIWVEMLF